MSSPLCIWQDDHVTFPFNLLLCWHTDFQMWSQLYIPKINTTCQINMLKLLRIFTYPYCMPAVQKAGVQSLGWEDPLEKKMATNSSILAWKIPWTEESGRLLFMGLQRAGHDWALFEKEMLYNFLKHQTSISKKVCTFLNFSNTYL